MKNTLLIFYFLISFCCFGQYTEEFQKFAEQLSPIKTEPYSLTFRKGQLKEKGTRTYYEVDGSEYYFITGKYSEYYSNGQVMIDAVYDDYGKNLSWKLYDGQGNLMEEYKTTKIDTDAKDLEGFLFKRSTWLITSDMKRHRFSPKICGWFMVLEGTKLNNKRIGIWKRYRPDGSVKKERSY